MGGWEARKQGATGERQEPTADLKLWSRDASGTHADPSCPGNRSPFARQSSRTATGTASRFLSPLLPASLAVRATQVPQPPHADRGCSFQSGNQIAGSAVHGGKRALVFLSSFLTIIVFPVLCILPPSVYLLPFLSVTRQTDQCTPSLTPVTLDLLSSRHQQPTVAVLCRSLFSAAAAAGACESEQRDARSAASHPASHPLWMRQTSQRDTAPWVFIQQCNHF